jgi:hypothetical protein
MKQKPLKSKNKNPGRYLDKWRKPPKKKR